MSETPDQKAERLQALITRLVAHAKPIGGDAWRVTVRVDVDDWTAIVEAAHAEEATA